MRKNKLWHRVDIFQMINKVYPTYSVGQHYVHDEKPYVVLKSIQQQVDPGGSQLGGFQYYNILCYVPDNSILQLDEMLKRIKDIFKPIKEVEFTGVMNEDFHETEIRMYMRYLEIRVPKEV